VWSALFNYNQQEDSTSCFLKLGYYESYESRLENSMAGTTPVLEGKSTS